MQVRYTRNDLASSLKQQKGYDGELEEIWLRALCSAVRRDDPLASAFGSVAGCRGRAAFTLGLRGLGFSLRRTGVSHQLPQELKLRQEELPHHVPPYKQDTKTLSLSGCQEYTGTRSETICLCISISNLTLDQTEAFALTV